MKNLTQKAQKAHSRRRFKFLARKRMLAINSSVNLPAYVLGACIVFVVGLNAISYKHKLEADMIDAEKKGVVTRLLIDR